MWRWIYIYSGNPHYGCIYHPCPCRMPPLWCSSYCMQVNLHTCVYTYGYEYWGEKAATRTASLPLWVPRAVMFDGSPGLLRWRCCHGGGFPLQYVRTCFMTHSFLTLGFYPLWWCIYYHCCLHFLSQRFLVMYSCIFTYECVFHYVLGQRWPNKQVKSINNYGTHSSAEISPTYC